MMKILRGRLGRRFVQATALAFTQLLVHAGPGKGPGSVDFPAVALPEVARGQKAVQALGAKLPEVAKAYGMRPEELQALLSEDASLAVDLKGRLHFIDPVPDLDTLPAEEPAPEAVLVPLNDTFKLHSRPGARRTVYLDFDGHLLSGTGWNTSYNGGLDIVAPAWDIDGNPSNFGDVERTRIQQIWQRVAEDFAPFDVDVTTELLSESAITRSTSADENFGTRVLISAISSYFGSYGGIAYVGAFDDLSSQYKPALVFPENLGNSEKNIAEAATHEAGHNLGLNHDGTTAGQAYYSGHGSGVTGWAPIMGVGYYKNVTQWSKGEYLDANNKQDDYVVMQSYGLPYALDDHGNTAATARNLPAAVQISASGVIERNTDVDVFAFTTGPGNISITVVPSDLGPNLDVRAEIRDGNGTLLASNNPADQLSGTFMMSAGGGTYFLHVRGTGLGDPLGTGYSDYGSVGQYQISGTVVSTGSNAAPVASATATPTSGTTPLQVQFDGSTSSDSDGTIVNHVWTFGDGVGASGPVAQHTYQSAGTFTATLTVTDDRGATASTSLTIQVQPAPVAIVRVQTVSLTTVRQASGTVVRAMVKTTDASGVPVAGVVVNGLFDSVVSGTATAATDANGNATLVSRRSKKSGVVTFNVTGLSKSGYVYDVSQNLQSSAAITLSP